MPDSTEAEDEVLFAPLKQYGLSYYLLVSALLAVVAWGAYAYYVQLVTGLGVTGMRSEVSWAFYIVNFVFFIGISHVGALVSAILRLTNTEWRKPITRMAEVVTFSSLIVAVALPLIDLGRPDRMFNIFLFARIQSPLVWDFIAIATYVVGSLIFLYLPMIPDIAACRDKLSGVSRIRRKIYNILALGWKGSEAQFKSLDKAIMIMTILIIPIAISVHTVVSYDFAMTLRVGWNSTIFGPYFVGGAILSGVATIILLLAVLTRFYHLEHYITMRHFHNLGKLLLALDVILIYLTINEYVVPGYKFFQANTAEGQLMTSLVSGPYAWLFWFQIVGGLIIPAFIVAIPKTRTLVGYIVAALLVDVGMWVERFDIIVPGLAVPQLDYPWGIYFPTWVEISIVAATFAGFMLIYLVFTKVFPIISIWESKEVDDKHLPASATGKFSGATKQTRMNDVERGHPSRREFLKQGTAAIAGLTMGLAIPPILSKAVQSTGHNSGKKSVENGIALSSLGQSVSLSQAKQMVTFPVANPSVLPSGSALKDVRVAEGGKMLSLLYENSALPPLSIYREKVAIAILIASDPLIRSPPKYLPSEFVTVRVQGREGFGKESSRTAQNGRLEPAQLQWWSEGARNAIFANLPVSELRKVAESMEANRFA